MVKSNPERFCIRHTELLPRKELPGEVRRWRREVSLRREPVGYLWRDDYFLFFAARLGLFSPADCAEPLLELVDPSLGVDKLFLASEERV